MNDIAFIGAEFVQELARCTPEEFMECKLVMLSSARSAAVKCFLKRVFELADQRRLLLLEEIQDLSREETARKSTA